MKKKLALFGALKLGTADYIAHLYPYLAPIFDVKVYSFSHMANDDLVTATESELAFSTIQNPRLLLRPATFKSLAESYIKLTNSLLQFQPQIFNLHVTAFVRVLHYFFRPLIVDIKKMNSKIVFTMHDVEHIGEKHLINNNILSSFYSLADAAIVGNEQEKKLLRQNFSFQKPTVIAQHGTYNLFDRGAITVTGAKQKLGYDSNGFVVLFFGFLRENKGLDILLKAVAELKNKKLNKTIKLYVAATVRNQYEQIKLYQNMIESLGISDKVKVNIQKDSVFNLDEIETYFKASDCVALPYTTISQSGVINLAFGFNKPVIFSDAFISSSELDGKLGIMVPSNNVEKLTEAIEKMTKNYSEIVSSFNRNIQEYNTIHSWDNIASALFELSK